MFTGIIKKTGLIKKIENLKKGKRILVKSSLKFNKKSERK